MCAIPNVTRSRDVPSTEERLNIAREEKAESLRATQRGDELLRGLEATCLYWTSGWWTYKFCYSEGITQFHAQPPGPTVPMFPPKEDPNAGVYNLGKRRAASEEESSDPGLTFNSKSTLKALVLNYSRGTYCPIIGAERKTDVYFQCSSTTNDRIAYVKEVSSCRYSLVVLTPRLCHDVAFQTTGAGEINQISCSLISDEPVLSAIESIDQGIDSSELTDQARALGDTIEEAQLDLGQKPDLSHLTFGEVPEALKEMMKSDERAKPVGGARPPDKRDEAIAKDSPEIDRLSSALEMANDIADQLEEGTMTVNGESIFDAKNENVEFDVELQDEHGAPLGNVVMKVVDGEIVIELEEELAKVHEEKESKLLEHQNQAARQKIPADVQAGFDRFLGRDEL